MIKKNSKAVFTFNEKSIDLPILDATIGNGSIDVSNLFKTFGLFVFDPGYTTTSSCKSTITYIDGDKGILMHRGYKIENLVAKKSFLEVAYLLLFSAFPTNLELKSFEQDVLHSMQVAIEETLDIIKNFDKKDHPMPILMAAISKLSAKCEKDYNVLDLKEKAKRIDKNAIFAVGAVTGVTAAIYRYLSGKKHIDVNKNLSFSENFLYLMFADDINYKPLTSTVLAIDKLFILHADHEQNASTSVVRSVGSTGANMIASVVGGIAALWGPLHGGANEEVLRMLEQIGSAENIDKYLEKAEAGEVKLMGFGHRVYKNKDPRATVIKNYCDKVLAEVKNDKISKMLEIAQKIEQKALAEEYFIKRKLFPNVDFYSGIIYSAIGIPTSMFTPLFAVARTIGWVTQWKELLLSDEFKINRPRQIYLGDVDKEC